MRKISSEERITNVVLETQLILLKKYKMSDTSFRAKAPMMCLIFWKNEGYEDTENDGDVHDDFL